MSSGHLTVPRTARYHLLGDAGGDWSELWVVLHGYGQLAARFLAEFEAVASDERLFAAPEGLSRFYLRGTGGRIGASWMTREDREREIADYVGYLDRLHEHLTEGRANARLCILGFSQGTATALRWAVLGRPRAERVILWGSGAPPDLDVELARERLSATRVELVAGDSDEVLSGERLAEERERLETYAPGARLERFEGGHRLDAGVLARRLEEG